jgi:ribosomal protein L22
VLVTVGPVTRRWWPRARGSAVEPTWTGASR